MEVANELRQFGSPHWLPFCHAQITIGSGIVDGDHFALSQDPLVNEATC